MITSSIYKTRHNLELKFNLEPDTCQPWNLMTWKPYLPLNVRDCEIFTKGIEFLPQNLLLLQLNIEDL